MTRTSYEKRKVAVEYCMEHGKDYKATAASFGCTYQQIYGWVRTYHSGGLEKLYGIHKTPQKKLTEVVEENKRLKKRESALELELAVRRRLQQCRLQRLGGADFSGTRNLSEYQVIEQLHQEQNWPVGQLCKAVGVSRAAYYKWKNRTTSQKQSNDEQLASLISEIYQSQHGIPGYIAENTLNRKFTACRPNEKWLTDVTEFQYGDGRKAYLSAILDLYGRNIVSFSVSRKNDTALVLDTFERAFLQCYNDRPLVHSDRGTQYTSHAFRKRLEQERICQSMSRPGKCLDNAHGILDC